MFLCLNKVQISFGSSLFVSFDRTWAFIFMTILFFSASQMALPQVHMLNFIFCRILVRSIEGKQEQFQKPPTLLTMKLWVLFTFFHHFLCILFLLSSLEIIQQCHSKICYKYDQTEGIYCKLNHKWEQSFLLLLSQQWDSLFMCFSLGKWLDYSFCLVLYCNHCYIISRWAPVSLHQNLNCF